jgi:SAM-dependent methyltransferase
MDRQMKDVSGTYDALAARWDDWAGRVVPDLRSEWATRVDAFLSAGERVVELGCGTAEPVGRLLALRYDYAGVDASRGMLERGRQALPGVSLTQADMRTVQYPVESLGAVLAFFSISHTRRDQHAELFGSIRSWLRPGGVFIGNLNSRDDPDGFDGNWLNAGPMRWSGFDGEVNLRLLAEAGFSVLESTVIDLTEPDGATISPMWCVAQRRD